MQSILIDLGRIYDDKDITYALFSFLSMAAGSNALNSIADI